MSDLIDLPLVGSKLEPAHRLANVIGRPRLKIEQQLARGARMFTMVAPAGFGKSTTASAWRSECQSLGWPCAWLQIDRDDDEPGRFMLYLCLTLSEAVPGLAEQAINLLIGQGVAAPRVIAPIVVNSLQRYPGQLILFLDDYHKIGDPGIHDFLSLVMVHAPPRFRLVVTSRGAVPLNLAALHSRGEVLELGAADLRFDEEEVTALVASLPSNGQRKISPRQLLNRTEGWPAAVSIASLDSAFAVLPDASNGRSAEVMSRTMERLLEVTVAGLPESLQSFLAATSILDCFNVELCAAVSADDRAAGFFEQLRHSGLLVEAIDSEGRWLRHHALLRSYLTGTLTTRLGVKVPPLHQRASRWFASRSRWIEAVRHGIAAGDLETVGEWVSRCALELVQKGDLLTLMAWARQLPPAMLRDRAGVQLALAWAYALAMRFDEAEHELRLLELRAGEHPDAEHRSRIRNHALVVRVVKSALQDDEREVVRCLGAWDGAQSVDRWAANSASSTRRWLSWHAGDWVSMYAQPWQSAGSEDDLRDVFTEVYREMLLGSAELERGRLDIAESHVHRALQSAAWARGAVGMQTVLPIPIKATILYERGDVFEAREVLTPWLDLIDNGVMLHGVGYTYLCLARIARIEDPSGQTAFRHLEHAEGLGRARGWDRLVTAMLLQQVDWLAQDERFDEAQACLERIEQLAGGESLAPRRLKSELAVHRVWAAGLLLLHGGEGVSARTLLESLWHAETAFGNVLRSIRIGIALAHACDIAGDVSAADDVTVDVLRLAGRAGSSRGVLDHGPHALRLIGRLRGRPDCDAVVDRFIERLAEGYDVSHVLRAARASPLTGRETQVLELVSRGLSNKLVARELGVSSETVKTHLSSVYAKLEVGNRLQAVAAARSLNLMPPAVRDGMTAPRHSMLRRA
jgi:LuxR family maltose regulon positive regulatory protein